MTKRQHTLAHPAELRDRGFSCFNRTEQITAMTLLRSVRFRRCQAVRACPDDNVNRAFVAAMSDRTRRDPAGMGLPRSTVKHPFGTIKAWMGATHFPNRRLRNVRTETAFHVLACTLKRMINRIVVRGLLAAILAYRATLSSHFTATNATRAQVQPPSEPKPQK